MRAGTLSNVVWSLGRKGGGYLISPVFQNLSHGRDTYARLGGGSMSIRSVTVCEDARSPSFPTRLTISVG